jgi:macrodomain Ter protein organizer (MatP/YcbG family)
MSFKIFNKIRKTYGLYRENTEYFKNVYQIIRTYRKQYFFRDKSLDKDRRIGLNEMVNNQLKACIQSYRLADDIHKAIQSAEKGMDLEKILNRILQKYELNSDGKMSIDEKPEAYDKA